MNDQPHWRQALHRAALVLAIAGTTGVGSAQTPTATLVPLVEYDGMPAGGTFRVALQVSLPEGFHVQSNAPRDPSVIATRLTLEPPADVSVTEIVWPAPVDQRLPGFDEPLAVFEHDFVIGIRLSVRQPAPAGEIVVPGQLTYQACNDTICFAPKRAAVRWRFRAAPAGARPVRLQADTFDRIPFGRGEAPPADAATPALRASRAADGPGSGAELAALEDFAILGATGGYLGTTDFLAFVRDAEAGVRPQGLFEGRTPLAILLIVFLGGLALNLTPCVLPMIPINLAIIGAGARAGSRVRGFMLGGVYGSAMALVYGALGLVVILTAGSFGTINASPWFNLAITLLFVLLGLAMFDLVTIDFSRLSNRAGAAASSRGTFLVAFTMGAVAALLAGACVAPVVIQVVLFSSNLYAGGVTIALALPFVLGIGMATPWPIAGAGLAALPKPGAWMVRVKQALGIVILGTAAYYGYQAYSLFANRWVDAGAVASSVEEKLRAGWHSSLIDGLEAARRDDKPVLVDLWATWCKNCLVMDKTTLDDPAVRAALDRYVKVKFQAEDPDREPARAVMRHFDAVGLPAYVILRPKN